MPTADRRLLVEGARAFNRGEHFLAHELWEALWLTLDGPERTWVQGLIQLAAGLHKLDGSRRELCRSLLDKGVAKLHDAPDMLDGLLIAALRDDARALSRRLASADETIDLPSLTLRMID